MTVIDLLKWAALHDAMDLDIEIQYRDDGGYYVGTDSLEEDEIQITERNHEGNTLKVISL